MDLSTGVKVEGKTEFLGYEGVSDVGQVVALLKGGAAVQALAAGDEGEVFLDRTPFYAESGGQVGDTGELGNVSARFLVADTQKRGTAFSHLGKLEQGEIRVGDKLAAKVDAARRKAIMANHSATHLLHAALRQVLGTHVQQKGSLVAPDRLRFDFSHFQAITPEELRAIERLVNEEIRANTAARHARDALRRGRRRGRHRAVRREIRERRARAALGDFSMELCGGTHVARTGDIGIFKIVSEGGVAAGVRRIEAITAEGALDYVEHTDQLVKEVAGLVRGTRDDVKTKVADALERIRQLEKENRQLKDKLASGQGTDLSAGARDIAGVKLLAAQVDGADAGALRNAVDQLKDKLKSAIIVLASVDATNKITLVAGVTADQTSARSRPASWSAMSPARSAARAAVVPTSRKPAATTRRRSVPRSPASKASCAPSSARRNGDSPDLLSGDCRDAASMNRSVPSVTRTIVQKYGGTSVGSVELIQRVAEKVAAVRERGDRIAVVVSAMGDHTDRLVDLAAGIAREPNAREMDVLLSTGEQVSIALLAMALCERGIPARSFTGSQVRVRTTSSHRRARITAVEVQRLQASLEQGEVPVVAGFQGVDDNGDITTIGRGGSDTSAVALAVALKADECQILTDVDGVYTTDPRLVADARLLPRISFEEMLELAGQGSRVLHLRSVEFAAKYNVPLRVLSSFRPGPGTLICKEDPNVEAPLISGIAFNRDEAQITVAGLPDTADCVARVLRPISSANIEVDMIVLATGRDGLKDLSFTVHRDDFLEAQRLAQNITAEFKGCRLSADNTVAKLAIVGVGMRSHAGVATQLFESLARQGVKALLISTSEIKIAVLIPESALESCVKCLHEDLGLSRTL